MSEPESPAPSVSPNSINEAVKHVVGIAVDHALTAVEVITLSARAAIADLGVPLPAEAQRGDSSEEDIDEKESEVKDSGDEEEAPPNGDATAEELPRSTPPPQPALTPRRPDIPNPNSSSNRTPVPIAGGRSRSYRSVTSSSPNLSPASRQRRPSSSGACMYSIVYTILSWNSSLLIRRRWVSLPR